MEKMVFVSCHCISQFSKVFDTQSRMFLLFHFLVAETRTSCVTSGSITYIHVRGDNVSISCLNTTRNSNTFRLKLRRTNKDTDILSYSNISSYHQRWSVTNNTGNVTVDLKDIGVLDAGQYECDVQMNSECITTQFNLKVKGEATVYIYTYCIQQTYLFIAV